MATLDDIRRQAAWQGLMNMGASLMASSGPSRTPQNAFQGLGAGFQGFGQGYDQSLQSGTRQLLLQQQLDEQQRKQEAQAKIASLMAPSPSEQFSGGLSGLDISKPSIMPNEKGAGAGAYSDPRLLAAVSQYSPEAAIGIMGQREAQKLADTRQSAAFKHAEDMQKAGFGQQYGLLGYKEKLDEAKRARDAAALQTWAQSVGLVPSPTAGMSPGGAGMPAVGPTVGAANRTNAAGMPGSNMAAGLVMSGNPELAKLGVTSLLTEGRKSPEWKNVTYPDGTTDLVDANDRTAVASAKAKGGQLYNIQAGSSLDKLTELQGKSTLQFALANQANEQLGVHDKLLTDPAGFAASKFGTVGNYLKSPDYQKAEQSSKVIAEMYLRAITGAAAPEPEVLRTARSILPVPGDDDKTILQKRATRATIVQTLKAMSGPGAKTVKQPGTSGGWSIEKVE